MGVYWISQNNITLHYISVAYHAHHGNYRICHTYHGVYRIFFQWPTNVPSCPVHFFIPSFFSAPSIITRGGGGGDPGKVVRQVWQPDFFLNPARNLAWMWLMIHSLAPYPPISEDNRDSWTLSPHILKKLTDNGKIGVESIFILQNNHNYNQPGYWKGQICVSHIL